MFRRKTNIYEGGTSNEDEFDQLESNQRPQRGNKKGGVIEQIFESVDAYGEPITLKYKGRSTYTTVCGGITTLVTVILILILLINKLGINQQMSIKVEDLRDLENLNKGIRSLIQINMSDKIVSENERTRNLQ